MRRARLSRGLKTFVLAAAALLPASAAQAQPVACMPGSDVLCLDQGGQWTNGARTDFYSGDQGSTMIPLAWFKALKLAGRDVRLADNMASYGYLPNPFGTNGLPIGFTAATWKGTEYAGMTCAACHTRDLVADGKTYRVDGGPAISDFQAFLTDMVDAVGAVLKSDASFAPFAAAVLGPNPSKNAVKALRQEVTTWHTRENAMKKHAYGQPDLWGLGRLDAVSMILNRVGGLDMGKPPTYLIEQNIAVADAPVRYPFLWNAAFQDKTQWPGFAPNGSDFFGLIRNTGEVYGVFATFHPKKILLGLAIDYTTDNSANFKGLLALEDLIDRIGPPRWPFPVSDADEALAEKGAEVFARDMPGGSCASCHDGANPSKVPFAPKGQTIYGTPLVDVGTDTHEHDILVRTIRTAGVLDNRALLEFFLKFKPCKPPYTKCPTGFSLLTLAVANSILWSGAYKPTIFPGADVTPPPSSTVPSDDLRNSLVNGFGDDSQKSDKSKDPGPVYESRVLRGIWAAAPYLHNGSVATLDDLLTPSEQRPVSFKVGPNFDPVRIGLAADQPGNYMRVTTDCAKGIKGQGINSGNSRCGHDFGTQLAPEDRAALLAYLRSL